MVNATAAIADADVDEKQQMPSPNEKADLDGGIAYWNSQSASNDGVMGGFGHLSQIDALSSRMFLLTVMPRLSTINASKKYKQKQGASAPAISATHPSAAEDANGSNIPTRYRTRAVDAACGIGRVTASVLLPLVDEVHLYEPVEHYIKEAHRAASAGQWKSLKNAKGDGQPKACKFFQASLQSFDLANTEKNKLVGSVGEEEIGRDGYDIVWAQWCLGHLSDAELVDWLIRAKGALRSADGVIIVKENATHPSKDREYDEDDKSWTRSTKVWEKLFKEAGLTIVRKDEQRGFPPELFAVWMYALR